MLTPVKPRFKSLPQTSKPVEHFPVPPHGNRTTNSPKSHAVSPGSPLTAKVYPSRMDITKMLADLRAETRSRHRRHRQCDPTFLMRMQHPNAVHSPHGTKGLLDHLRVPRSGGRFRSAAVLGTGSHGSDFCFQLVVGISERVVLTRPVVTRTSASQAEGIPGNASSS